MPDLRGLVNPCPNGGLTAIGLRIVEGNRLFADKDALSLATDTADPLKTRFTGLLNRKSFDKHVLSAISSLKKPRSAEEISGDPCFSIFYIDHFKEVNDNYGHLLGDEVILRFAQIMQRSFRHYDLLFRYGGEEFCIILFDGDEQVCKSIMKRFRLKLESFNCR